MNDTTQTVTETRPQIDLRALSRAIGLSVEDDGVAAPRRRVTLLEHGQQAVSAEPLNVDLALDGIQALVKMARREHRTIHLAHWAVGAVELPRGKGRDLIERLALIVSWKDADFARTLPGGVPEIVVLDEHDPAELDTAAQQYLLGQREQAEIQLAQTAPMDPGEVMVIDGSIRHHQPRTAVLLGLVKTTAQQFLSDEQAEIPTRAGYRSPTFLIHSSRRGEYDRYSCYLRLHDCTGNHPWPLGLVRLEANDPKLLEPFAGWVMTQRQQSNTGDPRWRRHAAAIRYCEDTIRARRPAFFDVAGGA